MTYLFMSCRLAVIGKEIFYERFYTNEYSSHNVPFVHCTKSPPHNVTFVTPIKIKMVFRVNNYIRTVGGMVDNTPPPGNNPVLLNLKCPEKNPCNL